ncbi:flagellar motor switch protein FliN [Desulfotomaculum copahuensis]|uniref:Flagellar motor switch protein FliN n=1 Tax=Desulfotomaculum copahuensis TaxID=1838280 RepID=A0A1B7LBR8_9FIRM|nr:flagellar motor switch protein FliN [Desulfotomaculum copahuensis]OAT79940.1 flagellar motor switch protein FliN [Desulfotomaculum copahuensis]
MITEEELQNLINRMEGGPAVKRVSFPSLTPGAGTDRMKVPLEYLGDVPIVVTVELGRTTIKIRDILQLSAGSVVELDRPAGDTADVLVNDQPFARGEVIILGANFGVRIESIYDAFQQRAAGGDGH